MGTPTPVGRRSCRRLQRPDVSDGLDVARTTDGGNTLFVNLARIPFLLGDRELARMAGEISEWSPQFLDLDRSTARLALYCEQRGCGFRRCGLYVQL